MSICFQFSSLLSSLPLWRVLFLLSSLAVSDSDDSLPDCPVIDSEV